MNRRYLRAMAHKLALGMGFLFLSACVTPPETSKTSDLSEGEEASVVSVQSGSQEATNLESTIFKPSGEHPAMWQLGDEDTIIYLFGTFHLLPENIDWQTPLMEKAMSETDVTYFEADTTSAEAMKALQEAVLTHGFNPPGTRLSSILGPARAARFATIAESYGLPMQDLESMRPWLASLQITLAAYGQLGFDPSQGAETFILDIATVQKDRLAYLETGTDQILAFAEIEAQDPFASFDEGLEQLIDPQAQISRLLAAWQSGDISKLEAEIVTTVRQVSPISFEMLFVERNQNWVQQIETLMDGEGDYFIAVGAGHLVGEKSVVDLLRDAGYLVVRVQ